MGTDVINGKYFESNMHKYFLTTANQSVSRVVIYREEKISLFRLLLNLYINYLYEEYMFINTVL